jgi:hypothetical protein
VREMTQSEQDYLSMGRQIRIDLALSLDIHRSNGGAHAFKSMWGLKDSKDPKQALAEQLATTQLEINEDTNPFFRKFINKKLKDKKRIADHIADLTFIMLWDILSETQPTIRDLTEKEEYPDSYVIDKKEGRRLINKYYDYMHYHPYKWSPRMEKLADNPENFVFSFKGPRLKRPLPDKKKSLKPIGTPITEKEAFNTEIRIEDYADPYYLERLFSYRKKVLWMLETIDKKRTIRKEYRWVKDQLIHSDYALTIFFKNAAKEVERRWFDYSLSPATKIEIIYQHLAGYYTEPEIASAINCYKRLCEDVEKKEYQCFKPSIKKVEKNFLEQITLAAVDFANRGETNISRWLFSNLLANGFKLEGKDKVIAEHNLAIFEMLHGEPQAAVGHFEASLKYWASEQIPLLEEIERWNFNLALDRTSKDITSIKQKHLLIELLAKGQSSVELHFFLIRQFADISEIFGEKFALRLWLDRGLQESALIPDFYDLALYFEARLGSIGILGSTEKDRTIALSGVQTMRENYCKTLGDTENFIVVIEKKFYLLREELIYNEEQKPLK